MSDERYDHDERDRRPYEAPAVLDTAAFETLALSCGKLDDGTGLCSPGGGSIESS